MPIKFEDVTKAYGKQVVMDHVKLTLEKDQVHCFFGPSGSGKTTALNLISGLLTPDSGQITGIDHVKIAYVFQEDRLLPWATVLENIMFVMDESWDWDKKNKVAQSYIELVNLGEFANHYPRELSGGMKQRVALARAYAYEGEIILMDEPYKGLEDELKWVLMDYSVKLWENSHCCLIYVTHDRSEVEYLSHKIGDQHKIHVFPIRPSEGK